jgi:hypothetical protein
MKFFPKAKKIGKCIPKYLFNGKIERLGGYKRNMGWGEIFSKKKLLSLETFIQC